ncbi:tripartite tricarboxylate transporter substrate binding protein [Reyranella sp. CPCC 100927]|uniref:Bug family tripartite tricarboxylate transporter substrate binding protein n=1 Tax=Reyranella sp. CPCC 100927 TaxID=2599616 RepID=UPI0011B54B50|nr:tripartite tricarboxylate transporter substrate binding protein [Reyranella sp. CPCC 100927]TWT05972.1 tripartite tricarboxylate transporter substrate binding protein [Reyranella sp. CPCC 100927]
MVTRARGRRAVLRAAGGMAAAFLGGTGARAQAPWPSKPIRVLSGGAPGGGSDIFVRILEGRLRDKLGQQLWIDNKPGAGGMVAAEIAARAAPDGHTFFVSNLATNGIGVSLYKRVPFDPATDLPGVARIATLSNVLVVRADSGIASVADLVAHIRKHPDKAYFGSAGAGTSAHLSGLLFAQRLGLAVTHVPYRGTAANLAALLAGEVLFCLDNLPVYAQHARQGTLKLLAVSVAKRLADLPDVPTLQEAGVPDFDVSSWYGLSAATGTPRPIIERMSAEIVAALGEPDIIKRIRDVSAEPAPLGPQAYDAFIRAEVEKWKPVVQASGAMVE